MKVYIFADLEGISGVGNGEYVDGRPKFVELGAEFMAGDINGCVAGCFDAGASEVIVRDGHSNGVNVDPSRIDPRAALIQGDTPGVRYSDFEGSAALILLGYHAMAGTPEALLEHSYSSKSYQNLWLNGRPAGEIGIDAVIAAEHGVPVALVTGDDKACREAEAWIPGVTTCEVKRSYDTRGCRLVAPEIARRMIREKTVQALKHLPRPVRIDYPATLRREYVERQPLPVGNGYIRIDGRTVERSGDSVEALLLT